MASSSGGYSGLRSSLIPRPVVQEAIVDLALIPRPVVLRASLIPRPVVQEAIVG